MKRENKKEIYSVRKFKVGVGSALIGLSFLGAAGVLNDVPIVGNLMGIEHVSADENNASNKISFEELSKTGDEPDLNKKQETYHFIYHKHDKDGTENIYNESGGSVNGVHNDGTAPNGSGYLYRISTKLDDNNLGGLMLEDNFYNYDDQEYRLKHPEINYRSINGLYKSPSDGKFYVYENSYLDTADHDSLGKPLYHVNLNEVERLNDGYGIEKEEITKSEKKYVKDETRDKGQPDIIEKGKDGVVKVTTLYKSTIPEGGTSEDAVFGKDVVRKTITEMKPTIVKVAAKDKVVTTTTPSPKKYVKDETREKGQSDIETKGKDGSTVTTTVYNVDAKSGAVTDTVGQPVVTPATDTIIKVAAKTKVTTKAIPLRKVYVGDTTKDFGSKNEETAGRAGSEKTTIVYDVNPQNGTVTERPNVERTEATDTIVKVGTKTKVVTKKDDQGRDVTETTTYEVNRETGKVTPTTTVTYGSKASTADKKVIPSPVRYEKDATREKGADNITVKGKDGEETVTTIYAVDPQTGKITPTVGKPVRTVEPTETVIKVAAKDKVETKELPNKTRYVADKEREKGTTNKTTQEGHPGREVTTTVYEVNPNTGDVAETVKTERQTEPVDTVISVGAKTKVEMINNGTKRIERTTVYDVNPETGKVTETVTDKLVGEVSAEPPVVEELPEFNTNTLPKEGVADKDAVVKQNGSGLVNEKPAFDESKIKVTAEDIQPTVRYEKDDSREKGAENIVVPGEVGQKKVTTVPVPDENGVEKDVVTEEVVKPAGETVVKVAAKTKVERIKDGTRTIERTTSYEVDPKTGAITETVTDKLISDTSAEPPVVDVPEFDLSKLPKEEPKKEEPKVELTDFNLGTGKNDFGPKKESSKVEVVPANFTAPRTEEVPSKQKVGAPKVETVSQTGNASATAQATNANTATSASKTELPYTGTADNAALTLAGISLALMGVGLAVKKRD